MEAVLSLKQLTAMLVFNLLQVFCVGVLELQNALKVRLVVFLKLCLHRFSQLIDLFLVGLLLLVESLLKCFHLNFILLYKNLFLFNVGFVFLLDLEFKLLDLVETLGLEFANLLLMS